jgi:hypothetical protein
MAACLPDVRRAPKILLRRTQTVSQREPRYMMKIFHCITYYNPLTTEGTNMAIDRAARAKAFREELDAIRAAFTSGEMLESHPTPDGYAWRGRFIGIEPSGKEWPPYVVVVAHVQKKDSSESEWKLWTWGKQVQVGQHVKHAVMSFRRKCRKGDEP